MRNTNLMTQYVFNLIAIGQGRPHPLSRDGVRAGFI